MKIKATRRFIDRANEMITRETGDEFEASPERANYLILLGLAAKVTTEDQEPEKSKRDEAAEASQNEEKAEAEEVPKTPKKTTKRTKKAAK